MIRRLLNRKAIKAISHRQESLFRLMELCQKQMSLLEQERDKLDQETLQIGTAPLESLRVNTEKYEQFKRMYWDAWIREEELSSLRSYLEGK